MDFKTKWQHSAALIVLTTVWFLTGNSIKDWNLLFVFIIFKADDDRGSLNCRDRRWKTLTANYKTGLSAILFFVPSVSPLKDPRGFPLDADPPGASFFIIIFVQLTRESKYKAEDEGPAASGALGIDCFELHRSGKRKAKNFKKLGKKKKKEKKFVSTLGGKRIWLAGSSSSSATACFVLAVGPSLWTLGAPPFSIADNNTQPPSTRIMNASGLVVTTCWQD